MVIVLVGCTLPFCLVIVVVLHFPIGEELTFLTFIIGILDLGFTSGNGSNRFLATGLIFSIGLEDIISFLQPSGG